MASVNRVILVGTLGRDPDVRYSPSGDAISTISIATSEHWKDKAGVKQEKTEWHNIVAYRKLAEIMSEYCKKGSQVYIEGKLQTRKWEKGGVTKYTTEIIADRLQMLGGKNNTTSDASQPSDEYKPSDHKMDASDFSDIPDDVPFMNPYKFNWRLV